MAMQTKLFQDENVAISGSAGFTASLGERKKEWIIINCPDPSSPPCELISLKRSPSAILVKKNPSIIRERSRPDYEESPISVDLSRALHPPPLATVTARNGNYYDIRRVDSNEIILPRDY